MHSPNNLLRTVHDCAHAPKVRAGKLSGRLHGGQHFVSVRRRGPRINCHEECLWTSVAIGQTPRLGTSRGENLVVGKQDLRGQPIGFGNEVVATVFGNAYAPQNDRVEQLSIVDDRTFGQAERQIVRLEGRHRGAGNIWIAADGRMFDWRPASLREAFRIQKAECR
jgi:hypothetical protein